MAFLLLLHQKMRLQRKENELTLKQLRFSSKVDRMQKKVDKRQKYYDKLRKQIERQANCYKNQMNIKISNMFGLGTNSVNLMNPYGSNGAAQVYLNSLSPEQMTELLGKDKDGNNNVTVNEKLAKLIQCGGVQVAPSEFEGKDGVKISKGDLFNPWSREKIDSSEIGNIDNAVAAEAYQRLQQMASYKVSEMQAQAQQYKAAYENNVSIWTEAQLEQLEYQEQNEMDLLAEEQADMEAEKNSVEVQLQRVQEEKKNIEQALGNAIQDSAPKFGLA